MKNFYEIYLTQKFITKEKWLDFINKVTNYSNFYNSISLIITKEVNELRFFIKIKDKLPTTINNLDSFLLNKAKEIIIPKEDISLPFFMINESNIIDIVNNFEIKQKGEIKYIKITIFKTLNKRVKKKVNIYVQNDNELIRYRVFFSSLSSLLSIDFAGNKRYQYKAIPKYLDLSKSLELLTKNKENALLKINPFPYLNEEYYLNEFNYSFNRHSLILGASGSGKSKLICLIINNLYRNNILKEKYKFVVIDPHAALVNDIGAYSKVIDFKNRNNSIDLFNSGNDNTISSTEIYLDLFKSLISDQYNSKLERVLRYSIYLLLEKKAFNFINLRNLLLDINWRTKIIQDSQDKLPINVINFFLNDFNELKTMAYSESISPIISFIDEMSMLPVFNTSECFNSLAQTIDDNFITLFSLDRTKLGDKITKTIAGLIMQNILNIIEAKKNKEHIIFIIDEVAILQNPILAKFLSEARKYNLSLILAGQYFNQISENLKDAIFANVSNYYLFRIAKIDAISIVDNISMKIPLDDNKETKINLLTTLPNRMCIARIEANGKLLSAIMGTTIDYESKPLLKEEKQVINDYKTPKITKIKFNKSTNINLNDILKENSTSRKELKNE